MNETFVYSNRHPRIGDSYESHTWVLLIMCFIYSRRRNKGTSKKVSRVYKVSMASHMIPLYKFVAKINTFKVHTTFYNNNTEEWWCTTG